MLPNPVLPIDPLLSPTRLVLGVEQVIVFVTVFITGLGTGVTRSCIARLKEMYPS
jgi:hypothetical protein